MTRNDGRIARRRGLLSGQSTNVPFLRKVAESCLLPLLEKRRTAATLRKRGKSFASYEIRFTPGGCHVPSPAGKIEGCVGFGQ